MKTVITHTAPHQADEVTAVAILRIINPDLVVLRTRDNKVIQEHSGSAFLLDVGGRYDPSQGMFDHHQPQGAGFRGSPEWPYATAGLVWKHYGTQVVHHLYPELTQPEQQEVVDYIDEYFIRFIDAIDCGVRVRSGGPSISAIIASFNPSWFEDQADAFPMTLDLVQVLLTNFIRRYAGKVLARSRVRKSMTLFDGRALVLDKCFPWADVVAKEFPDVLFAIYPVEKPEGVQWQLRVAVDERNQPRIHLPAHWGGHANESLVNAAGIADLNFCHRGRHLMGAASYQAIEQAAYAVLTHTGYLERRAA